MKTTVFHQLNDMHLLHRIWQNELQTAREQLSFYEELLSPFALEDNNREARQFLSDVRHFQRLIPTILNEQHEIEHELVNIVRTEETISTEIRKDQRFLQEEIDDFEANYHRFKQQIRQFLAQILI